jgi:hypothetical protein
MALEQSSTPQGGIGLGRPALLSVGSLRRRRDCSSSARTTGLCRPVAAISLKHHFHARYDAGMTRSKIAISLPKDQLARVHREVRAGRADSVSGYITGVLAEHERRESLRSLLQDLIGQYGEPAAKDIKWAERVLAPRRG